MDKRVYTDDLINEGQEPIIIRQESGGDKKFIYTLLVLLIILFIIALGIIAFLGAKFFNAKEDKSSLPPTTKVVHQVANSSSSLNQSSKIKPHSGTSTNESISQDKKDELAQLEALLAQEEKSQDTTLKPNAKKKAQTNKKIDVQKAIKSTVAVKGNKQLTSEEMAQIAKLVAQELAKMQQSKSSSKTKISSKANSDSDLVASLQQAQTDTLEEQKIDIKRISKKNIKAKSNVKKVDTFNKVIVKKKTDEKEDEFAKLTQEIDAILQTQEVKKKEESLTYKKELEQEAQQRAKELRFIVVKPGDTLSSIAYRAYGKASAYTKIYKANPDLIKNPNKIYVGMKLRVPIDKEYVGR